MTAKMTLVVKRPKLRNPYAIDAKSRKAGVMRDRRKNRGGARNTMRDLLDEYEDFRAGS